jgi:hypothetical protein
MRNNGLRDPLRFLGRDYCWMQHRFSQPSSTPSLAVGLSNLGPASRVDPVCRELAAFLAGTASPGAAAAG